MIPLSTVLFVMAAGILVVMVPVAVDRYLHYRGRRPVQCPETGLGAEIEIDAWRAARTAMPGPPDVRVRECTLWPGRGGCDQRCRAAA